MKKQLFDAFRAFILSVLVAVCVWGAYSLCDLQANALDGTAYSEYNAFVLIGHEGNMLTD